MVGEKRLYCQKFGLRLFGDANCFPGTRKYTLEPLRELEVDALACGDIEGIESITLKVYPDARHETLNETNRDEVETDLVAWLDATV